jgi:hypothetical protein
MDGWPPVVHPAQVDHKVDALAYSMTAMAERLRTADLSATGRALKGMQRGFDLMGQSMRRAGKSLRLLVEVARRAANDEVRVSGMEATMLVRGGMLGTHIEGDVDATVLLLMRDPAAVTGDASDRLLTAHSRARLAAALLRGHASQTRTQAGPVALRRHWCGRDVSVSKVDGAFVVRT